MDSYKEYFTIKIKKSYFKTIIMLILIISCTFGIAEAYEDNRKRYNTPEVIATKIMDLWKNGYYSKMYSLLYKIDVQNNIFLNKQDFINSIKNNKLESYSIGKTTYIDSNSTPEVNVNLKINGKSQNQTLKLKREKDQWFIDPSIFIEEIEVECPKYMTLKVNDKKVNFLEENQSAKLKVFLGASLKVTYESNYIDSHDNALIVIKGMEKITPSNMDIKLSRKSEDDLNVFINNFVEFNNNFTVNTKYAEIEKYIKRSSKASKYYSDRLNPYSDSPIKIENHVIEKIEFSKQKILVYVKDEKTKDIITLGVETFHNEGFRIESIYRAPLG